MALVVETGTGANPAANSYADLDFIRAYNVARGRAYAIGDVNDATATAQSLQAMDYIEAQEPDMQGQRVFGADQPLSWPRNYVVLYGDDFPIDAIPVQLKNAQAELAWQVKAGVVLFPTTSGQQLKRKKLGPIEKEWFGPADQPSIPAVDQWLSVLMFPTSGFLRTVRI